MCEFFSCIATKDGKILFCEDDSHEETINRANLKDNGHDFVRLEYTQGMGLRVDAQSIPEWYERSVHRIEDEVKKTYQNVAPALGDYNKIKAQAWEDYKKIEAQALEDYKSRLQQIEGYVGA